MNKYLFTVEDIYTIRGKGILLHPGLNEYDFFNHTVNIGDDIKLIFPNGEEEYVRVEGIQDPRFCKYIEKPKEYTANVMIALEYKDRVPLGTTAWSCGKA